MKKFTLFFSAMLLACATSLWAETYTIAFLTGKNSNSKISTSTTVSDVVEKNSVDFVASLGNCVNAFHASTSGVKLGNSSAGGTLEFTLADVCKANVKKITVQSVKYNKEAPTISLYVNGGNTALSSATSGTDVVYSFETAQEVSTIKVSSGDKGDNKRSYIATIIVETAKTVSVAVAEGQEEMGSVAMSYKANSEDTWIETTEPVEIAGEGDEEFQFVATPADGYKFAGWTTTGDITLTSTTEATTEGSAKETSVVTANFERNATLTSLTISGTATKVTYVAGDTFDPAGLVVTATYSDEAEDDVTDQVDWTFDPSILDEATTIVSVSATFKETNSAPFAVNVTVLSAPKTITIDLSKNETTTATAETLEWKGTILTITSSRTSSSTTAANNYYPGTTGKNYTSTRFYKNNTLTFSPADGITLGTITYTATSNDYATAMANSTWTNAKASVNGTTVTITPTDGKTAVSATIGANTGGTSFVINYFGEAKPTATESAAVETPAVKTIENGQLVILRDGVKYNAMGVRLQ